MYRYVMQNETNTEIERVSNTVTKLDLGQKLTDVFRSDLAVGRFNLYTTFKRSVFWPILARTKMTRPNLDRTTKT